MKIIFGFLQKIYTILLDHFLHNSKFLVGKRNYFFLCLFPLVIVVDKKFNFKIFKIRNFYDYITVREIFILETYELKNHKIYFEINDFYKNILFKKKIPLIIDCGANIGASSHFFHMKYPDSKIISIEPDKENFEFFKKNVDYETIEKLNKAISSEKINFDIKKNSEDPRAISTIKNINGEIQSVTVNDLLDKYQSENYEPYIIKIDIEGGEDNLFLKDTEWVNKFKIIIIEPHDWLYPKENTFYNFLKTISQYKRDFLVSGENIISIRHD